MVIDWSEMVLYSDDNLESLASSSAGYLDDAFLVFGAKAHNRLYC